MSPEDLANYVSVMREHNVSVFKTADIHIELGPAPAQALPSPAPRGPDDLILPPRKTEYERLLFAATEGFSAAEDE